jgi:ribosome maturation factor RimP
MAESSPDQLVRQLVEPVLEEAGVLLLDVSWHAGRRGGILRLTVDRPGGIGIDDCQMVSDAVSTVLDRYEAQLPDSYSLEVSSPGAERELHSEDEYRGALGRRVRLTLRQGDNGTVVEGRLVSVGEREIQLEARRSRSGRLVPIEVNRAEVTEARVVVDL